MSFLFATLLMECYVSSLMLHLVQAPESGTLQDGVDNMPKRAGELENQPQLTSLTAPQTTLIDSC